jgi:hypothetical protein
VRPNNLCRCSTGQSTRRATHEPRITTMELLGQLRISFPRRTQWHVSLGNTTVSLPPRCLVLRALVFTTCSEDTAVQSADDTAHAKSNHGVKTAPMAGSPALTVAKSLASEGYPRACACRRTRLARRYAAPWASRVLQCHFHAQQEHTRRAAAGCALISTQGSTAVTTRRGQSVCGDYFAGGKKVLQPRELRSMLQDFTRS